MREDLSRIVSSLIGNIGGVQVSSGARYSSYDNKELMIDMAQSTCRGLEVLKANWPGLTATEKEELVSVILALKTTYEDKNIKTL